MVVIEKQKKGKKTYYYLSQSYRKDNEVKKKRVYLGETLSKDLDKKKKEFEREINQELYFDKILQIKASFNKEYSAMPKSAKEKSKETFAIKFTYNTQKIEGSTLSLRETANLLEDGITPSAKPLRDVKEAEAHKKLFLEMMVCEKDISLNLILDWHKKLFKDTKEDIAGEVRQHNVGIAMSKFNPPKYPVMGAILKEFFEWYQKNKKDINPVELAALVHLKFVTIHPFGDGNGRISRLLMNFILKRYNFPLLDIPYTKRNSYYNALERSQISGDESIFVQWFLKRYIGEYEDYLE